MKKVIVSTIIIIICLLLSAMPLKVSGYEVEETLYKVNEDFNLDESINTLTLKQKLFKQSLKDDFNALKPEYEPGELIVKFRDNLDINFYASSVNVQYIEEAIQEYAIETMNTDIESSGYEQGTMDIGESETLQSEEVIMTGVETLDNLNIIYGLTYTEKLVEDDSAPEFSNVYRFCFNKDINVIGAVEDYSNDPNVEFAEPNYIYHFDDIAQSDSYTNSKLETGFIPNDPYFDMQWWLNNSGQNGGTPDADIDAPEAWDTTMGDDDVVVAVIDSGVDYTNPELGGCTDGIIELDYSIESPHPWDDHGSMLLNFSEIFPQYDFDSISLHFSKINNYVNVESYTSLLNFFDSKYMIELPFNGESTTDIWSRYTEMDSKQVGIVNGWEDNWGFAIDKVRLHKWRNVKQSEEYKSKFVDGYDFYCNDPDPMDDHGHGTHCAGIMTAITDNSIGVAGVAGNCKIMPIKVGGGGSIRGFAILRGLIFAANHDADIISMSFGGIENIIMKKALDYAYNKGCVLVASAGNYNCTAPESTFPGSYDKVIAVGATDLNDFKTVFSSYGSYVDVAAPGQDILSLRAFATDMYFSSGYTPGENFVPQYDNNAILYRASGTSMSGPVVAGVAALILSKNPNLTVQEVRTILRSSTDPVVADIYIGTGRINAFNAVTKTAPVIAEFDKTMNDMLAEGNFEIKGTASIKGSYPFEYFIEYGKSVYPSIWTVLKHSTSPLDGVLYTWNTLQVNDGPCVLRLRVVYNGFTYEDRALITIDNVANIYHVDDVANNGDGSESKPFNKIQYAVDICSNKDTIFVRNGVYNDLIWQETGRSAKIAGENMESTIIQEIIRITYGGISIERCTIENWGIAGYPTQDCNILDNSFISIKGIYLTNFGLSYLKFNIQRNNFIGNYYIYLGRCSDCKISENTMNGGIEIESSKRITISENQISMLKDTADVIELINCNNNDITDNTISSGGVGITVHGGKFNKICNNEITNMRFLGILLYKIFDNIPCSNNIISGNKISNVGYIWNGEHCGGYGIYLGDPDNYHVPDLGYLPIPSCSYNEITKNEIQECNFGIYLFGSTHNTVSENIISNNAKFGLYVQNSGYGIIDMHTFYSKNNKIYLNDFIGNGDQENEETGNAYDEGYNTWDCPILQVGNYWSDYTSKFPGADIIHRIFRPDIYDIPYDIPGGTNRDMYPLVNQHSNSYSNPQSNTQTQPSSTTTQSTTSSTTTSR